MSGVMESAPLRIEARVGAMDARGPAFPRVNCGVQARSAVQDGSLFGRLFGGAT